LHIAVQQDFSIVSQEADIHAPSMQITPTGPWVVVGVEAQEAFSSFVSDFSPKLSIPLGYVEEEASISIKGMEPTGNSTRSFFAPAISSG
jgi:hypothetical protein